jgi:ABC-type ATPase involved in cell division
MSERALLDMRRQHGFVFQDGALWENKSLLENLALPMQVHFPNVSVADRTRRVIRALERVGLQESASERPAAISGGEKKIAAFLRALIISK